MVKVTALRFVKAISLIFSCHKLGMIVNVFLFFRRGSVIVSFALFFKMPLATDDGLFELRTAMDKGIIGPYTVRDLKIVEGPATKNASSVAPTLSAETSTPTPSITQPKTTGEYHCL